jgi:hypothetical protein
VLQKEMNGKKNASKIFENLRNHPDLTFVGTLNLLNVAI